MGLLLLMLATGACSMEPHDLHGLRLAVEPVGDVLLVDGVAMRIRRAQGEDVPVLARRIAERWRADGDTPRSLQQRGWQMLARFSRGHSELIQWRGEGPAAQLLHSQLDATRQPLRAAAAPFSLPPQCAWGRVIESREPHASQVQRTAVCRGGAREVSPLLRRFLLAAGWQVRELTATQSGAMQFELRLAAVAGRLLLTSTGMGDHSVLVWMGGSAHAGGLP